MQNPLWSKKPLGSLILFENVTQLHFRAGADPGVEIGGDHMASAEREPIMGVWGLCPQRGPVAEPLVRRSGGVAEPLVRRSGGEAPLKLNAFWC